MFGIFKGGRENQAPHDAEAPRQERSIEDAAYDRFFTEIGGAVGAVANDIGANSDAIHTVVRHLYAGTKGRTHPFAAPEIREAFKYESFATAILGRVGKMSVDTGIDVDLDTVGEITKKLYSEAGEDEKKVSEEAIHNAFMALKR